MSGSLVIVMAIRNRPMEKSIVRCIFLDLSLVSIIVHFRYRTLHIFLLLGAISYLMSGKRDLKIKGSGRIMRAKSVRMFVSPVKRSESH